VADDPYDPRATLHTATSVMPPVVQKIDPSTACLVVIYGPELGKRIALETEALECGRSMKTAIPLDDDAVSRKHARFAWTGEVFVVNDLGSTNGTYVNDVSVQERVLRDGDQIKIGHTIFKFICGGNIELSYHEEIYRLMAYDGLTQIHNKRSFETALEREVSRAHRYRRPLSLVVFDIDHFKRVNDTYGHLAGDAVLRQLATLVGANIRREDILARVGGEEFALVLPEIAIDAARWVAEKLRAIVEATPCRFEAQQIPISASFGVAEVDAGPPVPVEPPVEPAPAAPAGGFMSAIELYKIADERLYASKRAGRNRVV
jgi:diguanylate cyclase (GGDEF)-like protein